MLSPTQLLCTNVSRSLVELARSSIFVVFKRKPFWEASFGEISVWKLNLAGWSPLVWNIGKLPITPGLFRARILPLGKIIIAPESAICNEGLPPPVLNHYGMQNTKHRMEERKNIMQNPVLKKKHNTKRNDNYHCKLQTKAMKHVEEACEFHMLSELVLSV